MGTGMGMGARLFSKTGPFAGVRADFGEEAILGRAPDNTVVLAQAAVSGRHARIYWDEEDAGYRIEDLGSRNGTRVAGLPLHQPELLGRLDVIEIAGVGELIFQRIGDPATRRSSARRTGAEPESRGAGDGGRAARRQGPAGRTSADAAPPGLPPGLAGPEEPAGHTVAEAAPAPLPPPLSTPDRADEAKGGPVVEAPPTVGAQPPRPPEPSAGPQPYQLEVRTLDDGVKRYLLPAGEHVVGRAPECDLVVKDPTLSRAHARLEVDAEGVRVIDLRSTNGTRVAGSNLEPGVPAPLPLGGELELGSVEAVLRREPVPTLPSRGDLHDP